jgi:hypothetical protein
LVEFLGVPEAPGFYPNLLGEVLIGIGIALFIEKGTQQGNRSGLGLKGAIAINLCAGFVLAGWLIFGNLEIPPRGYAFLWVLVIVLLGISSAELVCKTPRNEQVNPTGPISSEAQFFVWPTPKPRRADCR